MVRKAKSRSYPALYRKRFQLPGLEESVFLYFVVPGDVYCELNIITSSRGAAVELGDHQGSQVYARSRPDEVRLLGFGACRSGASRNSPPPLASSQWRLH